MAWWCTQTLTCAPVGCRLSTTTTCVDWKPVSTSSDEHIRAGSHTYTRTHSHCPQWHKRGQHFCTTVLCYCNCMSLQRKATPLLLALARVHRLGIGKRAFYRCTSCPLTCWPLFVLCAARNCTNRLCWMLSSVAIHYNLHCKCNHCYSDAGSKRVRDGFAVHILLGLLPPLLPSTVRSFESCQASLSRTLLALAASLSRYLTHFSVWWELWQISCPASKTVAGHTVILRHPASIDICRMSSSVSKMCTQGLGPQEELGKWSASNYFLCCANQPLTGAYAAERIRNELVYICTNKGNLSSVSTTVPFLGLLDGCRSCSAVHLSIHRVPGAETFTQMLTRAMKRLLTGRGADNLCDFAFAPLGGG